MITGYNDNRKAYMLVDLDTNKVIFSRHVVIDKEVGPFHTSLEFKIVRILG